MLQYHHERGIPLPVNLVCCFEGMEESGSEGLDELVHRESVKGGYFEGVDCVCIVCPHPILSMQFRYVVDLHLSPITTG